MIFNLKINKYKHIHTQWANVLVNLVNNFNELEQYLTNHINNITSCNIKKN